MTADARPNWALNLLESEQEFVQSFVDQVPEIAGARDKFVELLNKISGEPGELKEFATPWKFLFVDEDCDIYGSNDVNVANAAAEADDGTIVIDAGRGGVMNSMDGLNSIDEVEDVWTTDLD
jgi:hypothetical protein